MKNLIIKNSYIYKVVCWLFLLTSVGINAQKIDKNSPLYMTPAEIAAFDNLPSEKILRLSDPYKAYIDKLDERRGSKIEYDKQLAAEEKGEVYHFSYTEKDYEMLAKQDLFNRCRANIDWYIAATFHINNFRQGPNSEIFHKKEYWYKSYDESSFVVYPFESKGKILEGYIQEFSVKMAVRNAGKGEETVNDFYNRCMSLPIAELIENQKAEIAWEEAGKGVE